MKKLMALLLAVCLMAGFACFATAEETKTEYNFYGLYKSESMYFVNEAASIEKTLNEWADANGFTVKWHYLSSDSDAEKCLTQVNTAISDKADAIFICVPDQTMSLAVVELCAESDTLVVAVDDGLIDDDGNKIAPWFGIDAYNIGYAAGEWMADYAVENNLVDDESCGILYMTMETVSSCVPRTQGERDAWADKLGDAMSDRNWAADYNADENEAYTNALAVLTAHPEITTWLVMTASETGSSAAAAALEEQGLDETSCVIALGTDATALQWDDGNFAVIRASAYFSGKVVGQAAALAVTDYLLNGTEIPAEYATPAVIVTPENYKDIML